MVNFLANIFDIPLSVHLGDLSHIYDVKVFEIIIWNMHLQRLFQDFLSFARGQKLYDCQKFRVVVNFRHFIEQVCSITQRTILPPRALDAHTHAGRFILSSETTLIQK